MRVELTALVDDELQELKQFLVGCASRRITGISSENFELAQYFLHCVHKIDDELLVRAAEKGGTNVFVPRG